MINGGIFRQYDIRGRVETELDNEAAAAIAAAFCAYIDKTGRQRLILGRDNRASSKGFRDIIVDVCLVSGMDVVDIGEVITPVFYFAARHLEIDAGIMITASHNPGYDNGFKMLLGTSTIYGDEIQEIARMAERQKRVAGKNRGKLELTDVTEEYIEAITSRIKLGAKELKVVVDCGNGTAGCIFR